jgi:flagellar motor component MotA
MIQWNADLARRLRCGDDEKKGLGDLIARIMDLDRKARDEGFLSLESELPKLGDPLLEVGLRLVMEGVSGEALEEVLATYLLIEGRSGWHFLKACVIVEGLLALAESDDPELIARKLLPYFGADKALSALEELERRPGGEDRPPRGGLA